MEGREQRRTDHTGQIQEWKAYLSLAVLRGPGLWGPPWTSVWSVTASPLADSCFCPGPGFNLSFTKHVERMWQEVVYKLLLSASVTFLLLSVAKRTSVKSSGHRLEFIQSF